MPERLDARNDRQVPRRGRLCACVRACVRACVYVCVMGGGGGGGDWATVQQSGSDA